MAGCGIDTACNRRAANTNVIMSQSGPKDTFQLDAVSTEASLRRRLAEFAQSDAFLRNPHLADACRQLWAADEKHGGLVGQLWVEAIFPSASSGLSLRDLLQKGLICAELATQLERTDGIPLDRGLYAHQHAVIEAEAGTVGKSRPAIVVTAGTGAGKTEAFLLPVLNALFREKRKPGESGVRAIILYPMNALVNDQVERLYKWLAGQDLVTLFHFTGETPEDEAAAKKEGYPRFDKSRRRTRAEARRSVPDVLVTNYSMLEYMLCRPQDAVFFGKALRIFVADEAHMYTGTLAAEIALLLRRVLIRCGLPCDSVLQIATSATLGGDVREFAAKLFSKDLINVQWIRGESVRPALPEAVAPDKACRPEDIQLDSLEAAILVGEDGLVEDASLAGVARSCVRPLVGLGVIAETLQNKMPASVLQHTLSRSPIITQLENALWNSRSDGILRLRDLATILWSSSNEGAFSATARLLQLGARARCNINDLPLIPHKLHLMARAPVTLSACMNARCSTEMSRLPLGGRLVAEAMDQCPDCGCAMLTLCRCDRCGQDLCAGIHRQDNTLNLRPRWHTHPQPPKTEYWFVRLLASGGFPFDLKSRLCEEDSSETANLERLTECPNCGADTISFQPIGFGDGLGLPVVAETLLGAMPVSPSCARSSLPARGRRLLIFSDSRREAARLGPLLTRNHEIQLARALVGGLLAKQAADQKSIDRLRRDVSRLETDLVDDPDLSPAEKGDIEGELGEKRIRLATVLDGLAIRKWGNRLGAQPLLAEFFHRESAVRHERALWDETAWDQNRLKNTGRISEILAAEFASPAWNRISLETLGLAEVVYPGLADSSIPKELAGVLPEKIRACLSQAWPSFLAALVDTIRVDGAITLGNQILDQTSHYFPLGVWVSLKSRFRSGLIPFIGATERARRTVFSTAVLRASGCSDDDLESLALTILKAAFDSLLALAKSETCDWIEAGTRESADGNDVQAVRLVFGELYLRRPVEPYRCLITGGVWPRSVRGQSPNANGRSELVATDHATLDADIRLGRARHELFDNVTFQLGVWAEEHSAQLDSKENRRLQDLFSVGARNILSATTTLELGIDIGGLSGVMLGNVPPGKANYQQRGGRAGRRADGSSLVATYARDNAYNQAVFRDFSAFFHRELRKPTVLLGRERFGRRHLHAYFMGEFFRAIYHPDSHVGAMRAFNSIGWLCGRPRLPIIQPGSAIPEDGQYGPYEDLVKPSPWWLEGKAIAEQFESFLQFVGANPDTYQGSLSQLLTGTPISISVPAIAAYCRDEFHKCWVSWSDEYDRLIFVWKSRRDEGKAPVLNAIAHQANVLWRKTVIEELGLRRFLPRYGFPIGLQSLTVPDDKESAREPVSLERDGILAVSEYVPGSTILAGGKTFTSNGIVSFWDNDYREKEFGTRLWQYACTDGHIWYSYWSEEPTSTCKAAGCLRPKLDMGKTLLVPRYGYSTATWDPPSWSGKQERVGRAMLVSTEFLNPGNKNTVDHSFGNIEGLKATLCEGGEILATNGGTDALGFAICTRCGFADSEVKTGSGREKLPRRFDLHTSLRKKDGKCWGNKEAPVLRNHHLAAQQVTDLVQLDFGNLSSSPLSQRIVTTLGYALKQAGAERLELDPREIGMTVCRVGSGNLWGLQLFDSTAGGAGHVVELFGQGREWFDRSLSLMFRDKEHDDTCITSCLRCLLTTASQYDYELGLLARRETRIRLSTLLDPPSGSTLSEPE
jgi:DEAD/DEAH box helicase domain-containing protein